MKKVLLALLVIIIAIFATTFFNMEKIVKTAVNKYASQIVGTQVELEGFSLSLTKGQASATKLLVKNPEGYTAPYVFELENITVDIDINSIMTPEVIVEKIAVNQPKIVFEALSLQQNNIKTLEENIATNLPQTQKTESVSAKEEKPKKEVLIKEFILNQAQIEVYLPNIEPKSITIPSIIVTDFDGNPQKQIAKIFDAIIAETTQSVEDIAKSELKSVAQENLNEIADSIKEKIDLKGLF